jgi:hypothetical protein
MEMAGHEMTGHEMAGHEMTGHGENSAMSKNGLAILLHAQAARALAGSGPEV